MKTIYLPLLLTSTLGLTACIDLKLGDQFMGRTEDLKDDSGHVVSECTTEINPATKERLFPPIPKSWAKGYWEKHNLPKGTLYFTCDGDTPLLPKDCQGNELTTPQLRRYWRKYDLPKGTMEFVCNNGIPSGPAKRTS